MMQKVESTWVASQPGTMPKRQSGDANSRNDYRIGERVANLPLRTVARIAGLLYVVLAITGGFAELVRSSVKNSDSATATAANVLENEGLFRIAFASDMVTFSTEVALVLVIYTLFRSVSAPLAMLAAFLRLGQAAIMGVNMLNQFIVLLLLSGDDSLTAFDEGQLHALAALFLEAHSSGYLIGLVLFGLHNIVLGYLVMKSGFMPRVLGILLMVLVSAGYLIDSFGQFLVADYPAMLTTAVITPAVLVEITFILWLLVKGVRPPTEDAPATTSP